MALRFDVVPTSRTVSQRWPVRLSVRKTSGGAWTLLTTTSTSPSSSRSPKAAPRPAAGVEAGGPRRSRDVHEPAGAEIAIHDLALLVGRFRLQLVHLGIDVAVGEEDVEPAVVVEVDEPGAPAEPSRVEAEAAGERPVLAEAVTEVGVQRRRVAGEVRLDDVEGAVAIVVADADAHAGLRLAVLAVGAAGADADVRERAVVVVAIERARVRIVRHVDVGPAIVVEVERADAEAVGAAGLEDAGALRDVLEGAVALVAVEHVGAAGQPGRTARDRDALVAAEARIGRGRLGEIEVDVVGDEQIEPSVAVVVEEGGARCPSACRVAARPARAVTSVKVPSPSLRNSRFWP